MNARVVRPWAAALLVLSVLAVACGGTPAPPATPSGASSPLPVPTGTPAATPAATDSATLGPPSSPTTDLGLIQPGSLSICMSFNRSRFAERNADGNPFGVDVEIAQAIAEWLGLEAVVSELAFNQLIDVVVGAQCDVTVSGQFITGDRLAQIDMIPYREGIPHVVVQIGNPLGIRDLTDLCGRSFAVVAGTVYVDMVSGAGDYVGVGLNDQCSEAGAPAVDLREFLEQGDAEDALASGDVDAYAGNDFIVRDRPNEFEWALELPRTRNGIGHRLGLIALDEALRAALRGIIDDGTYLEILGRYGVEEVALTVRP